ncbi:hypothetical protein BWQ96_10371 [Gracilariopsis chorda]|uniref:Uncharacterized protein n=1 Tax=Gracilariopsis chorda TaxID=448386 RepID=A0A2V3ICY1_9FLOR|nr:hypothetical protein BWQ96_10371 [Gracilariopsis chorda]|eukprot:PXF39898.1 hypothetical protein BWQ96_10371 [Gracilariopsis chorda]
MTQAVGDLSLFFKHINGQLAGLAGTYVDDSMLSGSDEFMKSTDVTSQRFEAKPKALDNFVFRRPRDFHYRPWSLPPSAQAIGKLTMLPPDAPFSEFKSRLMSSRMDHSHQTRHFLPRCSTCPNIELFDIVSLLTRSLPSSSVFRMVMIQPLKNLPTTPTGTGTSFSGEPKM